ncbi:unnamed protein product [Alternaria alternata]
MAPTSSSSKPYSLAIVGGGISGLCLAIALVQFDVPVTIYEAAPHFGEIGAGVAFGPNAGRAMEFRVPKDIPGFFEMQDRERRQLQDGFLVHNSVGDALFEVPMHSSGGRGGVYRAHFLDELVKDVPDGVAKFDKRLVEMNEAQDGSGDIVLKFADGSTAQHSAVIGCDGIKSLTRKWLVGRDNPASKAVFSGKYAYRGLIPMDKAVELLGDDVARNSQMYLGYHGHLLTFPIEHGKTMNVVAFNSRDTWDDEKWVVTTSKEEMEADFKEWGPHVQKIVGAMQKPDIWALFQHPPCDTYAKGRVCLLGDAAHATTPHQGAGAGQCIEDSYILANLVKDANNVDDLQRAFGAFDQVRRERTQKIVKTSYEAGKLYDFELFGDDLDKIEENYMHRMRWIWDVDLKAQLEEAQKIMKQ